MQRRKKKQKNIAAAKRSKAQRWALLDIARIRAVRRAGLVVAGLTALVAGTAYGVHALDGHVDRILLQRAAPPSRLQLPGVPVLLRGLADADVKELVEPLLGRSWTQPDLCRRIAQAVRQSGWVKTLHHVRRLSDGSFQIFCDYRRPVAIVAGDDGYVLVDSDRVRLPGVYAYHHSWKVIEGVQALPPRAGMTWVGDDLRAGIALVQELVDEPFAKQVTAVLVHNFKGRIDPYRCHIELATDRAGGRIRWGSAPGRELEENSISQKMAILRANFSTTGRLDAHHAIIDISTLPDRYALPG